MKMKFFAQYLVMSITLLVSLNSCAQTAVLPKVFIKADPAVDAVLNRPPRTLRIFLTSLPNVSKSEVHLFGSQGEISLSHFHSMGADDLMIEIDEHPLPNGTYRVEWTATLGDDQQQYTGQYQFTVAAPN